MKNKNRMKYVLLMVAVFFAVTAWFGVSRVSGAVQRLESLEGYYTGEPVAVGKQINVKDFWLLAKYYVYDGYYESEDYEEVTRGFTISPTTITKGGENPIVVTYKGKTTVVMVEGKTVESISAEYIGDDIYVGATIPVGKIEAYAIFSDGTEERIKNFTLSTQTVMKEGNNLVSVIYEGKTDNIIVYGKAPLAVEEIIVSYSGESVIVGNPVNKNDFQVYVVYNDGSEPKQVTNFNISPSIIELEGMNEITISYGDVSATEYIYGEERFITDMRAKYIGPGVIVGKKVDKDDIEVIVTYNDGKEEAIDTFDIFGEEIYFEGENSVLVYCDSFSADVIVTGIMGFTASYDNTISNLFSNPDGYYQTEVTLAVQWGITQDKFILRETDPYIVDALVQRVAPTEEYIGFDLYYEDDEMVTEFPMAMKVTVPSSFDPEKTGVYYAPNLSGTLAKVDGEFTDETCSEYEFIVYEPGLYILVHEVSSRLVTDIVVETEVKMKENRSFSLNPVVFPLNAENQDLTFSSTDENVATVSPNGKIRSVAEGECEIWIETEDGSGVYVIVSVVVKNGK